VSLTVTQISQTIDSINDAVQLSELKNTMNFVLNSLMPYLHIERCDNVYYYCVQRLVFTKKADAARSFLCFLTLSCSLYQSLQRCKLMLSDFQTTNAGMPNRPPCKASMVISSLLGGHICSSSHHQAAPPQPIDCDRKIELYRLGTLPRDFVTYIEY